MLNGEVEGGTIRACMMDMEEGNVRACMIERWKEGILGNV